MEKDGKLKMVISNAQRQHPGSVDGKIIPREEGRPAGMIFFNERGDEVGGLIFSGTLAKSDLGHLRLTSFVATKRLRVNIWKILKAIISRACPSMMKT